MKNGLDFDLESSASLMKKGYTFIIANIGKTIALITLAVTSLVLFTEISFSDLSSESFTSTLVMMLIASYVMYFSLEDAGEKLGRDTDEYKAAISLYREVRERAKSSDISKIRQFCLEYRNAELEYRRSNLLFSLGYTNEEYEEYLRGSKVSRKAAKALRRVKKIRCAELDAASLISDERPKKSELCAPGEGRVLHMLISLVPSTVCMIFTISVMISIKDNLNAAGVIEALLKLSTLPIIGLKGYSGGYEYAVRNEISWIKTKTRLLNAFTKTTNKG